MEEIKDTLGPRKVFVGRELTKFYEEALSGTPDEILQAFAHRSVKGELVVVIEPLSKARPQNPDATTVADDTGTVDTENDGC